MRSIGLEDGTLTQMADNTGASRADVELRLPAEGAYATIVRTTAAGLAARLDFTIDDIEDLRIAIGEASALVIPEADPGVDLVASFWFGRGSMTVELRGRGDRRPPARHRELRLAGARHDGAGRVGRIR